MLPVFKRAHYPDLETAARSAADWVYSMGVSFFAGHIGPGGNNASADMAARAFTEDDLKTLAASRDPLVQSCGRMISLRQEYMKAGTRDSLQALHDEGQKAIALGLKSEGPLVRNFPRPV